MESKIKYLLIKVNNKNCYFRYKIDKVRQNMDANKYFELVKDRIKAIWDE